MVGKCKICHKTFRTYPSRVKDGKGKYCSRKCVHALAVNRVDYMRKYRLEYYRKYRQKLIDHNKAYYKNNSKEISLKKREWRKRNYDRINESHRKGRERLRKDTLLLLGNSCIKCGFSDWRALQLDHVNGGGLRDSEDIKHNPIRRYLDVKNNPNKYQLLCANCNWIKRYENKEVAFHTDPSDKHFIRYNTKQPRGKILKP